MRQLMMRWARRGRLWALALILALTSGIVATTWSIPAEAHCDSTNGPVVTAARQALAAGDVNLVLPYVKPEAEAEVTTAFQRTMAVRLIGGEAEQLAERWFFETAVRLHRAGEGAPYTGLKEITDFGPALSAADEALDTGDLSQVYAVLNEAIQTGVTQRYRSVQEMRAQAARQGTVAANRERVEAELSFEKYVDELHRAAQGLAASEEAQLPTPGVQARPQTGGSCRP